VKLIGWTGQPRADIRAMEKHTAIRILSALHRFAESGEGNVKLHPRQPVSMQLAG